MSVFKFKYFDIIQEKNALKVGTDSMLLGALVDPGTYQRVLDIGAGTGVLSLMMAQKFNLAQIDALEINTDSFHECNVNFLGSPWSNRMNVLNENFFTHKSMKRYDMFICNPPFYFEDNLNINVSKAEAKHWRESNFVSFFSTLNTFHHKESVLWIIFPFSSTQKISSFAQHADWFPRKQITIHSKENKRNSRTVTCFSKIKQTVIQEEIILRNLDNTYTQDYIDLTKEFHYNSLKIDKRNKLY